MKIDRVIISGGGTGGHIFPALAIANEISARNPGAEILFVGALDRMEMERVPEAGYRITGLPVKGFPRDKNIKKTALFALSLLKSSRKAQKIIKDFKPSIAIGVGGFASGPLLRAAARKRIPTLIQEQNSYAGITNKLLGKKAGIICVAYENMDRYFPAEKIVITGNPVRENLVRKTDNKKEGLSFFGLKEGDKVLLILGGSLGARSVNEAVLKNLELIAASGIQVIWQTGAIYYHEILERMKDVTPPNLHIREFLSQMDLAYAAADLVISRAGAGTLSELCLVGKPALLVPSPNVAEDHQTKNAMALVKKGAAQMIPDHDAAEQLFPEAFRIIRDPEKCRQLSHNISKLAKPDATRRIVDEAEKLLKKDNNE